MFNLNENNQFLISNAPTDMRVGVNAMCGKVRQYPPTPTAACGLKSLMILRANS